jgi:hypothetical protein
MQTNTKPQSDDDDDDDGREERNISVRVETKKNLPGMSNTGRKDVRMEQHSNVLY